MSVEVIIDGVRYTPVGENIPDRISIWYMHDNHAFTKIYGKTLATVLKRANEIESENSHGMLCKVDVMQGKKQLRRVGLNVHSRSSEAPKDEWNAGIAKWSAALKADADVMRLLKFNVK